MYNISFLLLMFLMMLMMMLLLMVLVSMWLFFFFFFFSFFFFSSSVNFTIPFLELLSLPLPLSLVSIPYLQQTIPGPSCDGHSVFGYAQTANSVIMSSQNTGPFSLHRIPYIYIIIIIACYQ